MNFFDYIKDYSEYVILGLAGVIVLLLILYIINIVQMNHLKKRYKIFMIGKDAKSLEDIIEKRLDQVDHLLESDKENKQNIQLLFRKIKPAYQKCGMVKYDAFNEMGGKLSFSLALLNEENDGFIMNAMHSREGCYTYIKEIVKGSSYIVLSEEEKQALEEALHPEQEK